MAQGVPSRVWPAPQLVAVGIVPDRRSVMMEGSAEGPMNAMPRISDRSDTIGVPASQLAGAARHRAAGRCGVLVVWQAASMLLADGAQAQGSTCDSFKAKLAERIEATGVREYSLEIVAPGSPTPRDGKVVGTCEGGARKIVYRRWGASKASADAEGAAPPASQAVVAVAAPAPARVPAPITKPAPSTPAANKTALGAAASPAPAASAASPVPELSKPVDNRASMPQAAAAAGRIEAEPLPAQADMTDAPKLSLAQRATGFVTDHWRWILPLALLPLLGWLWAWHAHRSVYDEAGLPRGPKL